MTVILYTDPASDLLCVVHPADPQGPAETDGDYLARIAARSVPPGVAWRAADTDSLPADRSNRAAWKDTGSAVVVDPAKQAAVSSAKASALKASAVAAFTAAKEDSAQRDRAVVLTAIDEINFLRAWITSFKAAVAASSSLTDLRTRVAALANLPQRSAGDAKTSITTKINSGAAD